MIPLFVSHIRPILEYSSSLWNLGYIGDLKLLESVQRRWTKAIEGLENLDYGARLRALNFFSVKGRLIRHDLIKFWQIFHSLNALSPNDLFTLSTYTATRGHPFKISISRCRLDLRKRFFNFRHVNLWNSLPSSIVSLEDLVSCKTALSLHLGDLLFDFH